LHTWENYQHFQQLGVCGRRYRRAAAGRGSDEAAMTYYQLLKVAPDAPAALIHESWRMLMRRYHPDNQQTGDSDKARAINEAHEVLMDPQKRYLYDVTQEVRQEAGPQQAAGSQAPDPWGHVDPNAYPPGYPDYDSMAEIRAAAENAITTAAADIGSAFIRGAMKNASPMLRKIFEDALLKRGMPK
jgi:curved DNA-binding protein CbpA